jgi:hypothetical protein
MVLMPEEPVSPPRSADDDAEYRTLRGALTGEDPQEPIYFAYSATLRIFGTIPDLDEITRTLGIEPTHAHRRGERRTPSSAPYTDMISGATRPPWMSASHFTCISILYGVSFGTENSICSSSKSTFL